MTQFEYTLNLYYKLAQVIEQEEEQLLTIKEKFLKAREDNDRELMVYLAKQYKRKEAQNLNRIAQYRDLEQWFNDNCINICQDNESPKYEDLEPSKYLCDKVWNKRSNR